MRKSCATSCSKLLQNYFHMSKRPAASPAPGTASNPQSPPVLSHFAIASPSVPTGPDRGSSINNSAATPKAVGPESGEDDGEVVFNNLDDIIDEDADNAPSTEATRGAGAGKGGKAGTGGIFSAFFGNGSNKKAAKFEVK